MSLNAIKRTHMVTPIWHCVRHKNLYSKLVASTPGATVKNLNALRVERLGDSLSGIVSIGIDRPEVRNAINFTFLQQLEDALHNLRYDAHVRVLIVRSITPGMFCSGADLKERFRQKETEYRKWSLTIRKLFQQLAEFPTPVMAAMDGFAFGGGLELALACDCRIAASNSVMGLPETSLAIIPGAGGTQRLCRLVGSSIAKELIFTGKRITANEALQLGLVNHMVSQNTAGDAAWLKCLEIASFMLKQDNTRVRDAKSMWNIESKIT